MNLRARTYLRSCMTCNAQQRYLLTNSAAKKNRPLSFRLASPRPAKESCTEPQSTERSNIHQKNGVKLSHVTFSTLAEHRIRVSWENPQISQSHPCKRRAQSEIPPYWAHSLKTMHRSVRSCVATAACGYRRGSKNRLEGGRAKGCAPPAWRRVGN